MFKRGDFKQTETIETRLADEARRLREAAEFLPYGTKREAVLRRADQADTAAHMTEWLRSSGLKPPT